ncbi:MAG: T9SS type A sorting domain-containing protein, partial [Bacteroidota bacterium]
VTPAGQAFYDSASILPIVANPALVAGSPLSYHINSMLGADSTTAFQTTSVDLPNVPNLMTEMMKWYRRPAAPPDSGAGKTKGTGAWKPRFDFDRRPLQYFRDTLDCAYSNTAPIYTAGSGGYPVGDLNWFPTKLTQWLADPVSAVPAGSGIAETFSLSQNYPNPFNPSTVIAFDVPKSANVRIDVFDLLGRQVATLVNGVVPAGSHTVRFEAGKLASGIYFYRLTSPNQVMTRKMMLLK